MTHLDLHEREYFGLLFNDTGGPLPPAGAGHAPDVTRWLDPVKPIRKQLRGFSAPAGLAGIGSPGKTREESKWNRTLFSSLDRFKVF